MDVERYVPEHHYESFRQWHAGRVQNAVDPASLPQVGFVVPDLAMGFLYQTDSKLCLIEALVANPAAPKEQRSRALDRVLESLIDEARRLGFRVLQGQTALSAVVDRVRRLG